MKDTFLTVVCYLWEDPARIRSYTFNPSHVVILRNMVARHLTLPHEFVCVTNSKKVADTLSKEHIRCVPLDGTTHVPGTVFARLMQRRPDIGGILGRRILSLDLDCVVVGGLDPIVDRDEESVWWRNPNFPAPQRAFYQTSIQLFTAGSRSQLWTDFDPQITPTWVNRRFGGREQAWISEALPWDEPYWDESHGVYGAGRLGGKGIYTELPENARIVFFPGNREPSQPEVQTKHPWVASHYY